MQCDKHKWFCHIEQKSQDEYFCHFKGVSKPIMLIIGLFIILVEVIQRFGFWH